MLEILEVALGDERTPVLPPFSAVLPDDAPAFAAAEGERGPMLASLIAAGRLIPDRGTVLLDGAADPAALRRAVALVDTPVVAEPTASLPVGSIVREELRFAGLPSRRRAVEEALDGFALLHWRTRPIGDLLPDDRLRLLLGLAAKRPGVRALVLTAPERHGGRAEGWTDLAQEYADRGMPVLVLGGAAAVEALPAAAGARPAGAER
jgi:ABC-2 type transport system ATP-binding protein